MNKIVFATHNKHKLSEIQDIIGDSYQVICLDDLGLIEDIPETANTLQGNAQIKAEYVFEKTGMDCFSDDTGLEITALDGAPGVFSARYAGEHCSFDDNVKKVLQELKGERNRKAQFRTFICLIMNKKKYFFEGKIEGTLIDTPRGTNGFGYDPIFVPNGYTETFAEMSAKVKNNISHRKIAVQKLADFLNNIYYR